MTYKKEKRKYEIIQEKAKSLKGCFLVENIQLNKKGGYPETEKHLITPDVCYPEYMQRLREGFKIVIGGCLK